MKSPARFAELIPAASGLSCADEVGRRGPALIPDPQPQAQAQLPAGGRAGLEITEA